jgi:hypothetical protein
MDRSSLAEVERLAFELPTEQQFQLLEHLAIHLRHAAPAVGPQDLYGAWKGRFPDDFDVDSALAEIRSGWQADELK